MKYILSVTEINKYIKELISHDLILSNLWIKGEISNYKSHYSGHMYFTLKDESGVIKCVMFKSHASLIKFIPENGMKVIIRGYISVYERDGQYQLYAEDMQPDGLGNLHLAFEQLKKRLEAEGIFDAVHKKPIPFLPAAIGVVTSSTGAVLRDIIHIIDRRFSNVQIKLIPVAVQGEMAAGQIARAVERFNQLNCVDVIIVARGGGSLEELWAFNEEVVARSIFKSRIPVISAVGHETDYTICDFAADLRAPTPSAAAELVVPDRDALQGKMANLEIRLKNSLLKNLNQHKAHLDRLMNRAVFRQPYDRVYQERMRLDIMDKYMVKAIQIRNERIRAKMGVLIGKLDTLSPLAILSRGYSMVKRKENGKILTTVRDTHPDDRLEISLKDGTVSCTVSKTEVMGKGALE